MVSLLTRLPPALALALTLDLPCTCHWLGCGLTADPLLTHLPSSAALALPMVLSLTVYPPALCGHALNC